MPSSPFFSTKGIDLTSAAALTLGSDGDVFHVTGATTITSISVRPAGFEITLIFDGTLVITHNATSLILQGGVNLTTAAGDVLKFVSEGSGNWRESGRRLAAATATAVPVGTVAMYGGGTAPSGWLKCDGSAVSRTTYVDLFNVLGTTYGAGDGSTTFNLPDARGRAPVGAGQGTGLTNRVRGATGGAETHTLTTAEMPVHSHNQAWQYTQGSGPDIAFTNVGGGYGQATTSTGGGSAHNNMQPFWVPEFIIKT